MPNRILRPMKEHQLPIILVVVILSEYFLITNSTIVQTSAIGEFVKTYAGLIGVIIGCIPVWYVADVNRKKIKQETDNLKADQSSKLADAVDKLKGQLADELEENLGKSETLKDLKNKIELRDGLILKQAEQIDQLTNDLSSEKAAGRKRDTQIAQLTEELTTEKGLRATAVAELESLKLVSNRLSEESTKKIDELTKRVLILENELRKNDLPIPPKI